MSRKGTPESFWSRVDKSGECWTWTGARNQWGYGWCGYHGKVWLAHRLAWALTNGPPTLQVLHRCDNPPCVRPSHLFLGTPADNGKDRDAKGRTVILRGEAHGMAKLTDAAVGQIRTMSAAGVSYDALAREFGVGFSTIGRVVRRENWR